ncbi:hypothetical protein LIER_30821 [Lithospermum erythrorhizon]|uniref:NUC153 domain-containing protein n=1 Tax=Lithospermum erythrorhizon TaxID=34254 RepID=A0AAV3RS69_LITER
MGSTGGATAPHPKKSNNYHHHGGDGGKLISDPRFASLHSDPRFREAPKKKSKVAIDSRFSRMFTHKNFASSKARIDKRGKTKKVSENKLKRYYSLEDEEEEEARDKIKAKSKNREIDEDDDDVSEDEKGKTKIKNKNRKLKEFDNEEEEKEVKRIRKNNSLKVMEEFNGEEIDGSEDEDPKIKPKMKNKNRKLEEFNGEESDENDDDDEDSESDEIEEEEAKVKNVLNLKKKSTSLGSDEEEEEGESDEDSSEISGTSSSESDSDEEGYVDDEDDTFVQEENIPEIDKETHRLAIVNMDWSQVKAADLYVLLSSFLPKGGQIKSVAVYPSEFGLQRMEEEAVRGPVGLFDDDSNDSEDDNDDDDDEEVNEKKLREYELSRLRYYYAVVECDSIATADYLYKTCDGVEFERSSVKLDLRFIPDSLELKHQPRDVATEAPPSYDGLDFETRALQQSKVDISWDDDEPQRKKALRRKFNDDQLNELELKEFLASDESGTDDDGSEEDIADKSTKSRKKQDIYRALLQSGNGSDGSDDEEGQDMEVTFNTGLEDISKRILENKDKKSETVWEAYLRKRKEKKKARKTNAKSSDDESDYDQEAAEQPDDFFIEEPSNKGKGALKRVPKENKKSEAAEAEASRAELELLLADDNGADSSLKGFNLKPKKSKGKKGKEIPDESKLPTVYEDPRFSQLINSPLFALDPTDPQFERSATYARQLVEKKRSGDTKDIAGDKQAEIPSETRISGKSVSKEEHVQSDLLPPRDQKPELSLMVKSIKMKVKQQRAPSDEVSRLLPAPKKRKKTRE